MFNYYRNKNKQVRFKRSQQSLGLIFIWTDFGKESFGSSVDVVLDSYPIKSKSSQPWQRAKLTVYIAGFVHMTLII
jgi:hypothetical protein